MKMDVKKTLTILATVLAVSVVSALGYIYSSNRLSNEVTLEIPQGATFNFALNLLESKQVIGNRILFKIYAMIRGDLGRVKPGEYRFDSSSTKKNVLDAITRGNVIMYKFTVPEGHNMYQIADLVSESIGTPREDFLRAASDPEILKAGQIEGKTAEGYLYPETYFFARGTPASAIVTKMIETFHSHYKPQITEAGRSLGLSPSGIITLASIIEKETGQPQERRLISSVFHNRLKRGMKLQSDPTTIYGIFERYRGNLTKKDLQENTPYNTYYIKGMPPGPIANPGIESIEAAVNPESTSYLYFVARKDKTHVFANNLKEHNANVKEFQLHSR